jgi:hypothetical protein
MNSSIVLFAMLLLVVLLTALPGCTLFTYDLTPLPTTPVKGQVHIGKVCEPIVLGLGQGNLRVFDAMMKGGIDRVSAIKLEQNYILVFGWNCLIVEGEGPGTAF